MQVPPPPLNPGSCQLSTSGSSESQPSGLRSSPRAGCLQRGWWGFIRSPRHGNGAGPRSGLTSPHPCIPPIPTALHPCIPASLKPRILTQVASPGNQAEARGWTVQTQREQGPTGAQSPQRGAGTRTVPQPRPRLWVLLPQAAGSGGRPAAPSLLREPSGKHASRGRAACPIREGVKAPFFLLWAPELPVQLPSQAGGAWQLGRGSRNSPRRQPVCGWWPTEGHSVPGPREHRHCTGRRTRRL